MNRRKVAVILGTRPEMIKMSPVIRALQNSSLGFFLVHTGQHYSYEMDAQFFEDLNLPKPDYRFERPAAVGANMHDSLVQWMTNQIRDVFKIEHPKAVLIQGDTDTVLAGARAAVKEGGIQIGHVEAGLRSYDQNMPEERNRVEADRLSHVLFAPTESARANLVKEGLDRGRAVEVTGNTIVDALFENIEIARSKGTASFQDRFALVTLHRPESVDNQARLEDILRALERLVQERIVDKVLFPIHPRTRLRLGEWGHDLRDLDRKKIHTLGPMGFLHFILHEKNAHVILTDSGGVQEEACILNVPCVTIRTTTERPETVEVGANAVAGYSPDDIVAHAVKMIKKPRGWKNPFGDGKAGERIVKFTEKNL